MAYLLAAGKTIQLNKKEFSLGRDKTCSISLVDKEASAQHARIWQDDGAWWVEDLHSDNGTSVNERKMLAGPVRLANGDKIRIGEVVLEYHDGQPVVSEQGKGPHHLAVGTKVGSYTIESSLDDGVATTAYKAAFAGGHVALHVVDQTLVAGDDAFAKRFLSDIGLAANVRHPGAVRIHRAGAIGRTAWYSTDIISGENLAHRLGTPLDSAFALDIAISLCEILVPYSDVGLVHGDLKPRSLALVGKNQVRLTDIGLIGLNDAERRKAQLRGTTRQAYYLCPQQAKLGDCNARSDMYSIGCMLVQMLTGRPPFIGADVAAIMAAHEREPIPQLAEQLQLPPLFDQVLGDLLHKEQFFRYDNTAGALTQLRAVRALITA